MDNQTIQNLIASYGPTPMIESLVSSSRRHFIRQIFATIFFALFIVVLSGKGGNQALGAFFIVFALTLKVFLFEFFFNSYLYSASHRISWPLAMILYRSLSADPVVVFLGSPYGRWIISRCGVSQESVVEFIKVRTTTLTLSGLPALSQATLFDFISALAQTDPTLNQFFIQNGIDHTTLVGATQWCENRESARIANARWWSRERLTRIPGIAKNWAYGITPHLDLYSRDVLVEAHRRHLENTSFVDKEIEAVERILSRSQGANVMIVGEKAAGAMDIVYGLSRRIDLGTAYPEIEHKRLALFDTIAFSASAKDKIGFEQGLIKILNEVVKAGNIIIVLDTFPTFLNDAHLLGVDLITLMSPYVSSLQIIAMSEPQIFHDVIEPNTNAMRFFETVLLKDPEEQGLLGVLESEVEKIENEQKVFVTFPAIEAITQSVSRYFTQGAALDKLNDLFSEIIPYVRKNGKKVIEKQDVLALVERKTGIPLGEMSGAEKDTLLHLETTLHQRIIGQDEAVTAISNAVRRARSGINNPNRPMGSFLFLGPTGVGKTETAKALAQIFFNNENQILRLDMSEYRTGDALERLIGSASTGKAGILASMLREKQYGVLLLDEFEKTDQHVNDLFLQILDEGFFTDASGKKVNARNVMIVATSNAGSTMIWDALKAGSNLEEKKSEIIDSIVSSGVYKPELLNRFDGIILFHPLLAGDLGKVARLMLAKLNKRLQEKGIQVAITDTLIQYLVEKGTDPKFGARSMNRAIQEKVEQVVAKKILSNEAQPGAVLDIQINELN